MTDCSVSEASPLLDKTLTAGGSRARRNGSDRVLRIGVDVAAFAVLAFVILSGTYPHPFPLLE